MIEFKNHDLLKTFGGIYDGAALRSSSRIQFAPLVRTFSVPPNTRSAMPNRQNIKLDRNTESLRDIVLRMAALAELILDKSLRAVWERSESLCAEVREDDLEIDRLDIDIDDAVLRILALDAPVANDLRLVVAIKSIATDLERVGDLARNIAGCALRLAQRSELSLPARLYAMADESREALRAAIKAFTDLDATAARAVLEGDDRIDDQEQRIVSESIERLAAAPQTSEQEIDLIFIARTLERVGDHATNIAEEVVLAAEATNLKHATKLEAD